MLAEALNLWLEKSGIPLEKLALSAGLAPISVYRYTRKDRELVNFYTLKSLFSAMQELNVEAFEIVKEKYGNFFSLF